MRVVLLAAAACGLAAAQEPRAIVRRAVQLLDRNLAAARGYAYRERTDSRDLDWDGHLKTRRVRIYQVTFLEGSPYRRLAGTDDRALSPDEERDEERRLQDSIAQRRQETAAQRAKRIEEWEKRQQRQSEALVEIPEAFNFRIAGEERFLGRDVWLIEAEPRPGYRPRGTIAKLYPKLRGKLWIDKADGQWLKTEAELTDNFWWGLFLARLNKGGRFHAEMTRVNGEAWLPGQFGVAVSARLAVFKKVRVETETTFSDYRKLQADPH
jgi:hypothetical protein